MSANNINDAEHDPTLATANIIFRSLDHILNGQIFVPFDLCVLNISLITV